MENYFIGWIIFQYYHLFFLYYKTLQIHLALSLPSALESNSAPRSPGFSNWRTELSVPAGLSQGAEQDMCVCILANVCKHLYNDLPI